MTAPTRRPRLALAVVLAAMAVAACFGIETPPGGIAAISPVVPPSPSVVREDTMRDSTGAAAPLRVYAFTSGGDTIRGLVPRFTVLGTALHIANDSFVVGDTVRDSVRIVADIGSEKSPIQTPPFGIPVTVPPDRISAPTSDTTRIEWTFDPTLKDSLQWSDPLSVTLLGPGDSAVVGFLTDYTLTTPLVARGTAPSAFIAPSQIRVPGTRDTTDATGTAGRTITLNLKQVPEQWLTDAVKAYFSAADVFMDSVVVQAQVQPRGYPLTGASTRTFVVVIRTRAH